MTALGIVGRSCRELARIDPGSGPCRTPRTVIGAAPGVCRGLSRYADRAEEDPERLQQIEER